jgi:APA family basic amino acid/polyamine antiporter
VALARQSTQLVRGLGALDALSLVVGIVIGTGVFLKSAIMAQLVGTPSLVLAAWIAAGLLSLAGALTYAELGAMLPETGGEYVFLRTAYGRAVAFQYGWMRVIVGASATAAVATSFATFLGSLIYLGGDWVKVDYSLAGHAMHWAFGARQVGAVAVLIAVAIVNCIGVVASGRTQTVLAAIKVTAVLLIIVAVFRFSGTGTWAHFHAAASPPPASA